MVNRAFRVLRTSGAEALGLAGCSAAQLAGNLSNVIAAYALGDTRQGVYRTPREPLAEDGPSLLRLFGSRWPVFSLLAWAQQLWTCDNEPSHEWACWGAEEPLIVRQNSMRSTPDISFWGQALALAKTVASMRQAVVWVNAARLAFEPAVTLNELMRPAAFACPIGAATLISLHGLYHPWGGEHFADAPAFAARVTDALNQRGVLVHDLINSPWPLPTVFWQLSRRVDHTLTAMARARDIADFLQATSAPVVEPVGYCGITRPAVVLRVLSEHAPYLGSWLKEVRSTGLTGTLVAILVPGALATCLAAAAELRGGGDEDAGVAPEGAEGISAEDDLHVLCFEGISQTLQHESITVSLALLERGHDALLLLDFDAIVLAHPMQALSDVLCLFSLPRPAMLFDRTEVHPGDAPDYAAVRFIRGASGEALVRNFFLQSEANPFLRVLMSLAHMDYDPVMDYHLPPNYFAHTDGFLDLGSVVVLSAVSPWLAALYRPLRFAEAAKRQALLRRLCELRLLPQCAKGQFGEVVLDMAPIVVNQSWPRQFAALFQRESWVDKSLRPRIFQIGPSSAGTTAIRDFLARHGLRTVKSYYRERHVVEWIERALAEGLPALHYMDIFDAYTDFIYPFLSRIPWCTEGCVERDGNVTTKVANYLRLVAALKADYPYSKFIFNTRRDVHRWLAAQMFSCWPHLDKRVAWHKWMARWEHCCSPHLGPRGNESCWRQADGRPRETGPDFRLPEPDDTTTHEDWAYKVCCVSLPTFQHVWKAMHEGVIRIFADQSSRLLIFPIEDGARSLSRFLGVPHRPNAWRKSHAG